MGSKKALVVAAAVFLVLVVAIGLAVRFLWGRASSGPVELTYWGLWEDSGVFEEVLADYKKRQPNVTVKYVKRSPIQYQESLAAGLAREEGPDLARIHNTWLPSMASLVALVPEKVFSPTSFKAAFYPVAAGDAFTGGKLAAIPLEIDTLGLYVNEDILAAAGVEVPSTWDEFRETARKLTTRDDRGRIRTAGVALGTAANVDHWQDILALMMFQAGVDMESEANTLLAQDALSYYTTFVTVDRVWDETLDNSTLAFASGKVGMYFGPSWRFFDIKNLNPNLRFRVVPVPQLAGATAVNYASYWMEVVSKNSRHQAEAFEFLKFLAEEETLKKLYSAQTKTREFGEPYPRQEMATKLLADPNVGPFVAAASSATSWYLASFTHDGETGINSRINKYYLDAVNGSLRGQNSKSLLDTVDAGVRQVLGDYGLK